MSGLAALEAALASLEDGPKPVNTGGFVFIPALTPFTSVKVEENPFGIQSATAVSMGPG